jgi:hypothetical protein
VTEPEHDEADAIEQRTPVDPAVDAEDPDDVLLSDEDHPHVVPDAGRFG